VNRILRAIFAVLAFFGSFVFIRLLLLALMPTGAAAWVGSVLALAAGLLAARLAWLHAGARSGSRLRSALLGALVLGALGFALGFFGPLVLAPDANQGPMLGIFVTGPGGALLGALLGLALDPGSARR